jgi:hypothetical protein
VREDFHGRHFADRVEIQREQPPEKKDSVANKIPVFMTDGGADVAGRPLSLKWLSGAAASPKTAQWRAKMR